jgi:hypothetical protein
MTRRNTWVGLAAAIALSLSLAACKDTKTLQENEQLKAQVAELQKQNGQMGNDLETVTAARDALAKENTALEARLKPKKKSKRPAKKLASRKRRRSSANLRILAPTLGLDDANQFQNSSSKKGGNRNENV